MGAELTVSRRVVLQGAAAASVLVATGCTTSSSTPATRQSPSGPAATARGGTTTRRDAPTRADWLALAASIDGDVIRRNNHDVRGCQALVRPAFRRTQPAGRRRGHLGARRGGGDPVRAAVRPGRSPSCRRSLLRRCIDRRRRPGHRRRPDRRHALRRTSRRATVGAGARLYDVHAALARHGRSIPTGTCPTVGAAGLALGGGLGVDSREHGLTCDRLVSAHDRHGGRRHPHCRCGPEH